MKSGPIYWQTDEKGTRWPYWRITPKYMGVEMSTKKDVYNEGYEAGMQDGVQERLKDTLALLRVARAGKTLGRQCGPGRSIDTTRSWFWDYELLEFFEALKEVEHLLD